MRRGARSPSRSKLSSQPDGQRVVAVESYGTTKRVYLAGDDEERQAAVRVRVERSFHSSAELLAQVFLPMGYPHSVTGDYATFYAWQAVQNACSAIIGILSTQAVLQGVGVGSATALATSAALMWTLRDGISRLSSIAFGWWKGSVLDCDAKQWRMVADIANDVGLFCDLVAPLRPALFLYIVLFGNVCKSIAGVAGGATRVSMTQHFALRDNIADLSAKAGSQDSLTAVIGMLVGMALTWLFGARPLHVWTAYFLLTFVHLFANYRSLKLVVLKTLNRQRADIVFRMYFADGRVLTPEEVCAKESIIGSGDMRLPDVELGAPLDRVCTTVADVESLLHDINHGYAIRLRPDGRMQVVLADTATTEDILRAYFECTHMHISGTTVAERANERAAAFAQTAWPDFVAKCRSAGWNLDVCHVNVASDVRVNTATHGKKRR